MLNRNVNNDHDDSDWHPRVGVGGVDRNCVHLLHEHWWHESSHLDRCLSDSDDVRLYAVGAD